jgi:hypothetical protein
MSKPPKLRAVDSEPPPPPLNPAIELLERRLREADLHLPGAIDRMNQAAANLVNARANVERLQEECAAIEAALARLRS